MTHTISVTGYGAGGDGVARLEDGRVVFVRGAARGDLLEVRLTREHPRSVRAEIVRVLEASPHRIEPDCPYFPECGGCDFRHVTYAEELDAKLRRVNDAMRRIGGVSACASDIISTGQTDGYRNKAVFHSSGGALGYYRAQSHDVVHVDRCLLLKDDINDALRRLQSRNGGDAPHVGDVTLRSGRCGLERSEPARSEPARSGPERSGPERGGSERSEQKCGEPEQPLEEELDGLVFQISGFFQVNTSAALLLYRKVREYAAMSKDETLVDLYCGIGSMTLFVGRDAGHALGIEQNPSAVKSARENALRNKLPNIRFICADAADWEADASVLKADATHTASHKADATHAADNNADSTRAAAYEASFAHPDCVIVDPPRKGLSTGAARKILELAPKRIIYVSCDPATLARDIRELKGYSIKNLCAIDMFPRTANVECCCQLA